MSKPYLKTVRIETFKQFVNHVESLRVSGPGRFWYRGCGRASYSLKPSLYRHKTRRSIEDCMVNEKSLFLRFEQRSIPFRSRELKSRWDMLFFMQHYGVPTRLLDWTENPFFGLFFATTNAPCHQDSAGKCVFEADASVWVLRPELWNEAAVKLENYDGAILTPDDPLLDGHKPGASVLADYPLAIYGAYNSERIVAQRGVFVVFGKSVNSMEVIHQTSKFPRRALWKLVIPRSRIRGLLDAIGHHGITDSVVFPDLDGLAREFKREFGFEV